MLGKISRHILRQPLPARPSSLIRLLSFSHPKYMTAQLPIVGSPVSATLPSDAFQLLSTSEKVGSSEDCLFEQQVQDVKQWWASSRYEGIKRPYSAEAVVSKRGSMQQTYPSSVMARKLFNLFNERAAKQEPVHTSVLRSNSAERVCGNLIRCSGGDRSSADDTASRQSRGSLCFRLGVFFGLNKHQ